MKYLIWSHEHRAWWAPNKEGYVYEVERAGRYSFAEVAMVVIDHIPAGEEVAIREVSTMTTTSDYMRYIWGVDHLRHEG